MPQPGLSKSGYDFKKIVFGKSDAYKETYNPELLLSGYLDTYGYIDQLIDGDKFFVFGQKGSGKSAIASKIELISKSEKNIVAKIFDLEQLDYPGFTGVIPGRDEATRRNLQTWEFLLAVKFIECFDSDDVRVLDDKINLKKIRAGLEAAGLIPTKNFNGLIDKMKHKAINLSAFGFGAGVSSNEPSLNNEMIRKMVTNVINTMYGVSPSKKHILIIDGLDGVLSKRNVEYEVLSSLITSVNNINDQFMSAGINCKVIVLCRNDVLDRLKATNKNKYVQDSGIQLDWYQNVADLKETNLNKLINLRAKISLGQEIDVIDEFFPPVIASGTKKKETLKYLLEHTRHTPRDFIELMNKIQKVSYQHGATSDSVKNGIRKYSEDYFVGEIEDGLNGLMPDEMIDAVIRAIKRMGKVSFSINDISEELGMDENKVVPLMETLYDAGAIININPSNGQYTSKYRNRHSSFDSRQIIRVHQGLVKAFSLSQEGKDLPKEQDEAL